MAGPDFLARMPIPPNTMPPIPPEMLARLPGQPGGLISGLIEPFPVNGISSSMDPKKSAEFEKRQVGIRLLQTGTSFSRFQVYRYHFFTTCSSLQSGPSVLNFSVRIY
jgi:hypothetical protein